MRRFMVFTCIGDGQQLRRAAKVEIQFFVLRLEVEIPELHKQYPLSFPFPVRRTLVDVDK